MEKTKEHVEEPSSSVDYGQPTVQSEALLESSRIRSVAGPFLDLSGAAIQGSSDDKNPSILLPNQTNDVSHCAIDIGGSLIKLIYFSRHSEISDSSPAFSRQNSRAELEKRVAKGIRSRNTSSFPILGGRLHFVKFETRKLSECLDFIKSKNLHSYNPIVPDGEEETVWGYGEGVTKGTTIKATGGGAFKYADNFKDKLGITLDKEDEMKSLVAGLNFLLRAVRDEAFTHLEGQKEFVRLDASDIYPYLLVNIGSGVSIIKVDGPGQYERVSGTNLGGGTFWGLGRLLTGCNSFDKILELSQGGDNGAVDMLVGDIYGGLDYAKIGLSASTIASSFGKVVAENKELEECRREDLALSLLRMISYNIGQIAYLNALRYDLKRIFFGGFFIRGHAYTMDTMSFAIQFWSKGSMQAMFLRHEGFLGALGAFLSYDASSGLDALMPAQLVERFPMGAPYVRGEIQGPTIRDLDGKISWMEKFVEVGGEITAPTPLGTTGLGGFERPDKALLGSGGSGGAKMLRPDWPALSVGVLHLMPSLEPFPLLHDPKSYEPNTVDLSDAEEREYWFGILEELLPGLVEKAVASEGATEDARKRGDAFSRAFQAHLARLRYEPAAYGRLGLAHLLELREECLREFGFHDAYAAVKARENEASLAVLPDLLAELDSMEPAARLLSLVEGVLASNIFDWGSRACVQLYQSGTILEIYRMSRDKMSRPWRVDDFDSFSSRMVGSPCPAPHKRAILFVDNAGADIVLGVLPLARELLRRGTEVVLAANSLPAINDMTAVELPEVIAEAAKCCDILRKSAEAGGVLVDTVGSPEHSGTFPDPEVEGPVPRLMVVESGSGSPCIDFRRVSAELAEVSKEADLVVLEGMGRSLHTNFNAKFKCDVLKLAMIKNQRLATKLTGGNIYDCVCRYEPQSSEK